MTADIPQYAILSHTWGQEDEEVTLSDMNSGTAKNKAGYAKIRFCSEQAAKDGLQYCWVDTCCFDKTSSAEISGNINSMFRFYKQANKCYAYLADVPSTSLEKSRWWSRGWTLQELIALSSVEFFSSAGKKLGSKASLERHITERSGIPGKALRGGALSEFTVSERMKWSKGRKTTRPEDGAYCLFGLFDVYMPTIYGEGEHAFTRLNEEIERRLNPTPAFVPGRGPPPSSEGSRYNCFASISFERFNGPFRSKAAGCRSCGWREKQYSDSKGTPTIHLSGREVPPDIVRRRFHHIEDPNDTWPTHAYRCFICRDDTRLHEDDFKDHLERNHTYAEVCS